MTGLANLSNFTSRRAETRKMAARHTSHVLTAVSPLTIGGLIRFAGELQLSVTNVHVTAVGLCRGGHDHPSNRGAQAGTPTPPVVRVGVVLFPTPDFDLDLGALRISTTLYEERMSDDGGHVTLHKVSTSESIVRGRGTTQVVSTQLPQGRQHEVQARDTTWDQEINQLAVFASHTNPTTVHRYRVDVQITLRPILGMSNLVQGPRVSMYVE